MARETDIIALQLQKLLRPFENQSGIVGTNTGNNMINNIPLINTSDILNQYNVPGLQTSDVFNQEIKEQNLPNTTNTFNPGSLQSIFPTNVQTGITASSAAIPFKQDPIAIAQGFTRNTPSDQGTNFQFLPSANEADETDEVKETKTGIAKLFDFLTNFIPGVGLLKRLGDVPGGIRSLNQRLRNTDFGRSRTLADYLEKRRRRKETNFLGSGDSQGDIITYDPSKVRERKRIMSIQPTSQDKARGQIPSRTTSAPKKSTSQNAMAADRARSRNEARTASRVSGGRTRAYGL
jgi:hypothetical protein